jgi:hypothetical protein
MLIPTRLVRESSSISLLAIPVRKAHMHAACVSNDHDRLSIFPQIEEKPMSAKKSTAPRLPRKQMVATLQNGVAGVAGASVCGKVPSGCLRTQNNER